MPISIGSKNAKPYVGNKEVKEAYVGSTLVYQNVPNYEYPPYVMNKGYTALEINGSNSATFVEGTGIVFTRPSAGLAYVRFNTPDSISTKKKGVVVVNGTSYSFNYPSETPLSYTIITIQITNSAPYKVQVGYRIGTVNTTTTVTTIDDNTNVVVSLLTIEDA